MLTTHKYREGLYRRFGYFPEGLSKKLKDKACIWLHAVSVGEVNAASSLICEILKTYSGHHLVLSTTTKTGQDQEKRKYKDNTRISVIYFPLDFSWSVKKYFSPLPNESNCCRSCCCCRCCCCKIFSVRNILRRKRKNSCRNFLSIYLILYPMLDLVYFLYGPKGTFMIRLICIAIATLP